MNVELYMSKNVITVAKETKIFDAVELMRAHNIHRLPVVENQQLIGLLTEGTIQEASPSKATSLSVYEMNYLLNKTTVEDVMIKDVQVIAPDALLEEAIFKMRKFTIGVLPVVSADKQVVGIITNNDIFDAFLEITGYQQQGLRISIQIKKDEKGVLANLTKLFAAHDLSITQIVVYRKLEQPIVVVQLEGSKENEIRELLEQEGYNVLDFVRTVEK